MPTERDVECKGGNWDRGNPLVCTRAELERGRVRVGGGGKSVLEAGITDLAKVLAEEST